MYLANVSTFRHGYVTRCNAFTTAVGDAPQTLERPMRRHSAHKRDTVRGGRVEAVREALQLRQLLVDRRRDLGTVQKVVRGK